MAIEKYYIPEIEEFHVGFEYIFIQPNEESINSTFVAELNLITLKYILKAGTQIKVKYLDKEDIESLGFDSYGDWCKGIQFAKQISKTSFRNYIVIDIDNITNELTITGLMGFTPTSRTNGERLFRGKIKNKSELIKLLKQLGI